MQADIEWLLVGLFHTFRLIQSKYQANKRILFKSNFVPFFLLIIIAFCARKDFEHFLAVIFMNRVTTSVLLTSVENKLNMWESHGMGMSVQF